MLLVKGQTHKCSHFPIYCKCSSSFLLIDSFTEVIFHPCWGCFFSSWIFCIWILFHNQHNMLLLVCVYVADLHSNHISSFSPSMLEYRCSRGSWEKVACAKYTVGINKHFIRPRKRGKPMYGGGAGREKKGGRVEKKPLHCPLWNEQCEKW